MASNFLIKSKSKTSQFEIVKLLARFNTEFNIKETFKFVMAIKVKNTWR